MEMEAEMEAAAAAENHKIQKALFIEGLSLSPVIPPQKQGYISATLFVRKTCRMAESYETRVTFAACKPFGPSSMENSTFCSASSLR